MADGLDETIPQWKKDLILRKRAGSGGQHSRQGSEQFTTAVALSSSPTGRVEQCDVFKSDKKDSKMVQDSVLVMRPLATNGDCCHSITNSDSDSSEELQYGPGIVSKLKSKYLSLTLRETHTTTPRPSILPLRRATSLEDLLDEPPPKAPPIPRRYTPRIPAAGAVTAPSPRYRAQMRRNGTEPVKRARSVETISRNQHPEEKKKPCRPLKIAPVVDQNERPPADHVKQTLRLFEGPALKRTKPPVSTGDVAAKVASFKQIIQQNKPNTPPPAPPLPLSPKPTILPPKPTNLPPPNSPIRKQQKSNVEQSPIPDVLDSGVAKCPTPDLIVHSSPQIQTRPFSPQTVQDVTQNFLKNEITHTSDNIVKKIVKPVSPTRPKSPLQKPLSHTRPKSPLQKPLSPTRPKSPLQIKPLSPTRPKSPLPKPLSPTQPKSPIIDKLVESIAKIPVEIPISEEDNTEKEISQQAVDNISEAGHTITYKFNDNLSSPKSHLPRLNSIPVRIKLVPDISSPPSKPYSPPVPAINTSISPHISSPSIVPKPPQKSLNGRPTSQPPKAPLTTREIEKNSINKMKTLEQPVSKVVVAMRSVDEVVAKKVKNPRNQQETTILFNFSSRDTIPDYIATDGSQNVKRGKREKPKAGESGIILLPGAPVDEFTDDDEDWMLSLNGPPSPCDVHFVNDNILIDGRSSISKQPKRQKLRIQFDDDATQIFEYLSEASALEDAPSSTTPVTSPTVTGHSVPSLTGSNFSNYTPSKMSASDFQLGVTRQSPVITSPPQASSQGSVQQPDSLDLLPVPAEHPVTYSAETTSDILF